jgi:hypothetical protein
MILIHFLLAIFYVVLPIIFVLYYRTYYLKNDDDKFFFSVGFLLKIFGAIAAVLVYTQYYNGGDTLDYFDSGKYLLYYLSDNLDQSIDVLFRDDLRNFNETNFIVLSKKFNYWYTRPSYTVAKISMFLNLLTFSSFFLSSILCSYFSFFCSWKFYRFILDHSRLNRKSVGYAIFFMPSVVFWGSGLFKDTFTLAGLNLLIVGFVSIIGYNKLNIKNFVFVFIGLYLLFNIRSFFILASMPFLIIWVFNLKFNSIPSYSIKFVLTPIFLIIIIASIFLIVQTMSSTFQELSLENLVDKSKGFQGWHTTLKGSAYSLGDIEYSTQGILSKILPSIVVTYFRPYIWEAGKPIIILSALQSLFFVFFTLYAILKLKIIYFLKSFVTSPPAIALMGFSLFYSMVVGFTSYNFGALDRYKIPCLSTYIIAILFILERYNFIYKTNSND